jgi:uncharacterized protein Yka (UPF0111/DUF47 family)
MRTYEKKIDELGKEIADEIINKENDPKWEIILDQNSVARSLSNIYDKGLKKVYEDLDSSVRKNLYRMRNNN